MNFDKAKDIGNMIGYEQLKKWGAKKFIATEEALIFSAICFSAESKEDLQKVEMTILWDQNLDEWEFWMLFTTGPKAMDEAEKLGKLSLDELKMELNERLSTDE